MSTVYELGNLAHKLNTADFGMTEILDMLEPHANIKEAKEAMLAVYAAWGAVEIAYHAVNKAAQVIDLNCPSTFPGNADSGDVGELA